MREELSQKKLAQRVGASQSRLSRIEAGLDDPLLSTVRKLAVAQSESCTSGPVIHPC
nr:helix-turn-helix domain-containing protein [Thiocapsa sp. KS1]